MQISANHILKHLHSTRQLAGKNRIKTDKEITTPIFKKEITESVVLTTGIPVDIEPFKEEIETHEKEVKEEPKQEKKEVKPFTIELNGGNYNLIKNTKGAGLALISDNDDLNVISMPWTNGNRASEYPVELAVKSAEEAGIEVIKPDILAPGSPVTLGIDWNPKSKYTDGIDWKLKNKETTGVNLNRLYTLEESDNSGSV